MNKDTRGEVYSMHGDDEIYAKYRPGNLKGREHLGNPSVHMTILF
jgi:hypothetical protein